MEDIEAQLHQKLIEAENESKNVLGYISHSFIEMIDEHGALQTVKILISKNPSNAYAKLWEKNRLDLTVEAIIIQNQEFHSIFSEEELNKAKERLNQFGYKV